MTPFAIRYVEKFPEPAFSALQREVFQGIQRESPELAAAQAHEASLAPPTQHTYAPMHRLGAFAGDELVGWSVGWMERGNVFYMANSGVLPSRRRQGVYTALVKAMQAHALSLGAVAIRSQHAVLNNAVLIAKLRAGFHVSGLSVSAHMGSLVELTHHFHADRANLFAARSVPFVVPDDA